MKVRAMMITMMMTKMVMKMKSRFQASVPSASNLSPVAWDPATAQLVASVTTQSVVESTIVQVPGRPSTTSCDTVAFSCQDLEGFLEPRACYHCKGGNFIALLDL